MSVGKNIRKYREERGLDQIELAERVDVSQSFLSKVECGRKSPGVELLADISKALDVSMDELAKD